MDPPDQVALDICDELKEKRSMDGVPVKLALADRREVELRHVDRVRQAWAEVRKCQDAH